MSRQCQFALGIAALIAMLGSIGCLSSEVKPRESVGPPQPIAATTAQPAPVVVAPTTRPAQAHVHGQPVAGEATLASAKYPAGGLAAAADGWLRGKLAFPTGIEQTSAILLEKSLPAEVIAGKPYQYELKVTNISALKLEGVQLAETVPGSVKLAEMPGQTVKDGAARYNIGDLNPGESKSIKVNATASGTGTLSSCASVDYNAALCMATNVVEPALKLVKTQPAEIVVCDTIPVKLVVTNSGTGTARNVKIEDALPAGMTSAEGRNTMSFDAGSLGPGQSKEVTFNAKVGKVGKYENKAIARGDDGLTAESQLVSTIARQPVLEIAKAGPERQYLGRPITFEITVTNKGDAPARETTVIDTLPAGTELASATEGGRSLGDGRVQWALGELAPGASRKVSLSINANESTQIRNQATAQAQCAAAVSTTAITELVGIPALLLECVDVNDPIEVGKEDTYIITVTNQGTATATNVKIVCALEDTMQFSSASGAARGVGEGKTVTFDPVPSIPPKGKAQFKVVVKAIGAGDTRFKIDMTADQLTRPVQESESSNFYK